MGQTSASISEKKAKDLKPANYNPRKISTEDRKDFIALFIDSVKLDYETGGLRRVVPYFLAFCFVVGMALSFLIMANKKTEELGLLIAALITAQGIILAMNMQTSGVILNNIDRGDFVIFLKEHKLLSYYMLLVQFMQLVHIVSLCCLVAAAISFKIDLLAGTTFPRDLFGVALGLFLYAMKWTFGASTVVKDLLYWKGEFEYNKKVAESLAKTVAHNYD